MFRNHLTTSACRRAARRPSFRPCCEHLETRWVPTTVTNLNDAGPGSLRQAIVDTPSGDIVDFEGGLRGTITLTTGELAIRKDLIISSPDAAVITVSGNSRSRVFNIAAGFSVEMYGLTIRNGSVTGAGATGGGILNAGSLLLYGSNVISNRTLGPLPPGSSASASGGGIRNTGTLYVFYSTIGSNSVSATGTSSGNASGAGISNAGELYIQESVVSANSASASGGQGGSNSGGGISNAGTLTVVRSILRNNTLSLSARNGSSVGGGIATSGTVTVLDSAVVDNTANSNATNSLGGGIGVTGGTVTVSNSTISGNRANISRVVNSAAVGGGLYLSSGTLIVTSSTITANTVAGVGQPTLRGGGLMRVGGTASLRNSIVAINTAPESPDVRGDVISLGYNLIGNTEGGTGFAETDLLNVNPLLGPLRDNGGFTLTHALLPGSPALDAGDPTDAPEFDQRGEGFFRFVGDNIDIGAFEYQGEGSPGAGAGGDTVLPPAFEVDGPDVAMLLWLSRRRDPVSLA